MLTASSDDGYSSVRLLLTKNTPLCHRQYDSVKGRIMKIEEAVCVNDDDINENKHKPLNEDPYGVENTQDMHLPKCMG